MKKNIASQVVCFHMLSTTDGSDITSGTPVVYVTGNGGTQATGSGTITHEGHGEWSYVPTQAETNYDHIAFTMVLSGAFSQTVNVYTTYPQTGDSYTAVGALNDLDSAAVNAACDTAISDAGLATASAVSTIDGIVDAILMDTGTTIPNQISGLNDIDSTTVNAACDSALADYDAPTAAELTTAISDLQTHGDSNWGSSGENPNVLLSAEISSVTSQTEFVLASGSDQDNAYNGQSIVLYDDSNSDYPSVRVVVDYVGSTKTLTIDSVADFTVGADDSIRIFVTSPGSIAPTASQVADAVWDEAIADHIISTTFGGKNQIAVPSATLDDYKADVSGVATASALATVDTVVDAIKLKTDNLPSDPANQSAIEAAITSAHNTTDGKIDALNDFDPDNDTVAHVTLVDTTTTNTDMVTDASSNITAIKAVTDNLPDSGALTSIAQASVLADVLTDTGATIPAQISGLNNLSSADVNAACDTALSDYGANTIVPPTVAEIRSEIDSNSTQLSSLVSRVTEARAGYLDKLNITGTLAHSDTADTYKADISSLSTSVALTAAVDTLSALIATVITSTGTTIPDLIENLNDPTASAIVEAILTEVLPDVSPGELVIGQPIPVKTALRASFNRFFREVTQTNVIQTVKNDSSVAIATMATIEEDGTQTKGTA